MLLGDFTPDIRANDACTRFSDHAAWCEVELVALDLAPIVRVAKAIIKTATSLQAAATRGYTSTSHKFLGRFSSSSFNPNINHGQTRTFRVNS